MAFPSFYCARFPSCVVDDDCVVASLDAAAGGAALAELAVSLVDGVEVTEAVSTLGLGVDGVELGAGSGLEEVGLGVLAVTEAWGITFELAAGGTGRSAGVLVDWLGVLVTVVVATFFGGILAGVAGFAGGCEALGAFATAVPASAAIAGLWLVSVAAPTSAGEVVDAVLAGCGSGNVLFLRL